VKNCSIHIDALIEYINSGRMASFENHISVSRTVVQQLEWLLVFDSEEVLLSEIVTLDEENAVSIAQLKRNDEENQGVNETSTSNLFTSPCADQALEQHGIRIGIIHYHQTMTSFWMMSQDSKSKSSNFRIIDAFQNKPDQKNEDTFHCLLEQLSRPFPEAPMPWWKLDHISIRMFPENCDV
jgi:hypothetical protein